MSESIRNNNLFASEDYQKIFKGFSFIDYTAYDFDTLKQALINYIQVYYPEDFNDYIESSEFIAIIELLAYLGTSLAFRTDLNSKENFIDTAERRESIIRLAQMVNYVPRRNVAASGLFKISAVQTNQPLTDASGINIGGQAIFWNDANNTEWFDQFVQVCNAAFSTVNPFGRPTKSGDIGSIPTDLYQLNNVTNQAVVYSTNIPINGQQYPVDICNPDLTTNEAIFERDPDPANPFNLIYRNDSMGVGSANTGFFLYFRQGNLINVDTSFDFPVPNRLFPIGIQDINQDDVYVQETDQQGNVITVWKKVPVLAGENIIYNSIQLAERNIFDVISGADDTITIRFADGNFGNVPSGLFRTWVRVSANQPLVIRPDDVRGLQIAIPYFGADQQQYTLQIVFNLEQTVGNAAPAETNDQIKQRAPDVFSTQSRMVNGSDYNVLPLVYGNQISKIKALARTHSGQSRYIDLTDPTGFHRDLIIFGQDGALYKNNETLLSAVIIDDSNKTTEVPTVASAIQDMLRQDKLSNFFRDEYIPQFNSKVRINKQSLADNGYSMLDLNNPYQLPLFWKTSPRKKKNDTGYFTNTNAPDIIQVPISYITYTGSIAIVVTASPHNLLSGRHISIIGCLPIEYNGEFIITVTSPTVFNYRMAFVPTSNATTVGSYSDPHTDPVTLINSWQEQDGISSNPSANNTIKYRPWGFIKASSSIQFAKSAYSTITEVWTTDMATAENVCVDNTIDNGIPTSIDTLSAYTDVGPVSLDKETQQYLRAINLYPTFRKELTTTELDEINALISLENSFWLYYDLLNDKWGTATTSAPSNNTPFSYADPISDSIYSDWTVNSACGLLYVSVSTNESLATTFTISARGRAYIFESYKDVRFFWKPNQIIIDSATGLAKQDSIELMPYVNTNYKVDNNNPIIGDPTTSYLTASVSFNISGVFTQEDGFVDSSKVEVSLADDDRDNIPNNPLAITQIFGDNDRVVYEKYNDNVIGYQSTRPWIARWGSLLQEHTGNLYVYFPVDTIDNANPTVLYSAPFISNKLINDPLHPETTANALFMFMDEIDLVFIYSTSQLAFSLDKTVSSIANQITAFFNKDTTTYPWLANTADVDNKMAIVTTYFLSKTFVIPNTPGYGVYNSLAFADSLYTEAYPESKVIQDAVDTTHFDKNGKIFTQNRYNTITEADRIPLYFKWSHYSPIDQRVDPAPTNIIDMVAITNAYYRDMTIWKNTNAAVVDMPTAPTTEELRIQFQSLNQYKMISDAMIWNSGEFKLLFGDRAAPELQATFRVVKSASAHINDNEVKTKVIEAIDFYFDIRNWDFGEKFFYTELAAFIHQQLARYISSVVIVPVSAASQFGGLFEIVAGPTQLFMSTATVNNVSIVDNLTSKNLRV